MANWQKAHEEIFGAKSGDVIIYDDFVSKRGILTANATTPYVISFACHALPACSLVAY